MYTPSFEEFKKMADKGNLVPVYRDMMADMETPVSAFLKIKKGNYSFLFESVEGGEKWARYCFLGCDPSIVFLSKGEKTTIIRDGRSEVFDNHGDPLGSLKKLMAEFTPVILKGLPRFFGGAVGFLSYDMVKYFEELPDTVKDDLNQKDAVFIITDSILIFDNVNQKIKIVSNVFLKNCDLREAYDKAIEKIDSLISRLQKPVVSGIRDKKRALNKKPKVESNFTKEDFKKAVLKGKEYIRNGDIIQVVLAQRLKTAISTDPFNIYRALRTFNPSPYMYYLQLGDVEIVGTSPEVLVRLEESEVEVRPIAGTRPRGITEEEDLALEKELLKDGKERAEHIMLVDLGRNDLGRIADIGSVNVNEQMTIERYSHVMHIVSNVRAVLKKEKDSYDVLRATFPAGTVSGAPKIRAMEIIDELEPTRRGTYAGAVGYFSFSGNMDTAIAIRTLVIESNTAYLGVGAGIVADSDPDREYEETINKGKALLKAIEMAEQGL